MAVIKAMREFMADAGDCGLTKNGKSPGSAGGLEKFDISGSPSGNFKP